MNSYRTMKQPPYPPSLNEAKQLSKGTNKTRLEEFARLNTASMLAKQTLKVIIGYASAF